MNIEETLIFGVVSGILTSTLIFIAGVIVTKILTPWVRKLLYSGIEIAGEWHCVTPKMNQDIQLDLKQKAKNISGIATFVTKKTVSPHIPNYSTEDMYEKIRSFQVKGEICDRFLVLNLKNVDPRRLGVNAFVLEVRGDGRKMQGAFSYYAPAVDQVHCLELSLFRDRSQAENMEQHAARENLITEYDELDEYLPEDEEDLEAAEFCPEDVASEEPEDFLPEVVAAAESEEFFTGAAASRPSEELFSGATESDEEKSKVNPNKRKSSS